MISSFKESLLSEIESCLLSDNIHFSSQQKEVLRNNNSVNVIAGPGSGKTTVLIAKCALLLKSENHKDKGICVITHTNVAVDEIKSGLKKAGINEISHPNFVGTIQDFIIQYFSRKAFHLFLKDTEMKILDTEEYYNQFCKVFSVLKPAEYSYYPPRLYFAIQMCTIMQRKVQNFASWVLVFRQRMRDTITVTCEI
ncbi:UvrD-helicase domain-containing protein [Exiguobacterium aurantiacum]|uniref:UvrD-helicase domain-containing protein n=1 Tax=Exiguobacterium aurantiacum TaxID=33987 RepID=A0ABY5FQG0_9BACL|nr:UvrD-helicase domain-containing protein [Exiguobacterium aurantiacum]UTT43854.1 UvrD-helicase domain-containing protein [Exiguobacterium aurantiacum]